MKKFPQKSARLRAIPIDGVKQTCALISCNIKHENAPTDALNHPRDVKKFRGFIFLRLLYLELQNPMLYLVLYREFALTGANCHGCRHCLLAGDHLPPAGSHHPPTRARHRLIVVYTLKLATTSLLSACQSSPPLPPRRCPAPMARPARRSLTLLEPTDLASALPRRVLRLRRAWHTLTSPPALP